MTSDERYSAITGSHVRSLLARGDREAFEACMPATVDRRRMWDILSATARTRPRVKATARPKKARAA